MQVCVGYFFFSLYFDNIGVLAFERNLLNEKQIFVTFAILIK